MAVTAGLGRILSRATATAAFGLAVVAAVVDIAAGDLARLSAALARGDVLDRRTAALLVDHAPAWATTDVCRRDLLIGAGRVAAAAIDATVEAGDVDRVGPAIAALERAARRLLDCAPGEGIGWTWLAMAADQGPAPSTEVEALYRRSQTAAPADLDVVALRLPALARARSRRGEAFAPLARADIRALFAAGSDVTEATRIVAPVFAWVGDIAAEEYVRIGDPLRREALVQAFGSADANLAHCPRVRYVDWRYRGQRGSCLDEDRLPDFDGLRDRR